MRKKSAVSIMGGAIGTILQEEWDGYKVSVMDEIANSKAGYNILLALLS